MYSYSHGKLYIAVLLAIHWGTLGCVMASASDIVHRVRMSIMST